MKPKSAAFKRSIDLINLQPDRQKKKREQIQISNITNELENMATDSPQTGQQNATNNSCHVKCD